MAVGVPSAGVPSAYRPIAGAGVPSAWRTVIADCDYVPSAYRPQVRELARARRIA